MHPAPPVRPAVPADTEALHGLVQAAYRHYIPRIGREPKPMTIDYGPAVEAGDAFVIDAGDGDDGIQAVLVLHVSDHVLIDNIAVRPTAQGKGLGSELMAFAERHARSCGLDELRLFTHELMTENQAYYRRRGYVETHREGPAGRVFFSKRLAPGG